MQRAALRQPGLSVPLRPASAGVAEMTSEEAIRSLFPQRIAEKVKRTAEAPDALVEPRFFTSPSRTEVRCRVLLERLRWPDGVRCPRCGSTKAISRIESRGQFECGGCDYQFSVRVGTIFQASHVPLWKWFLAVYIMAESKRGISANQIKRMLGVSYKTAWYLTHRIRAAMKGDGPEQLRDLAEAERLIAGHVGPNTKHLTAYLDEMSFRANNRGNPYLFRDLLLRLLGVESMPYTQLVASA